MDKSRGLSLSRVFEIFLLCEGSGRARRLMFFSLSKLGGFFVQPSNFLIIVSLFGAVLMWTRFRRAGQRILVGSILALVVCGFLPIGNWLLRPLEQRFPPWGEKHGAPDGIIVLGGVISYGTSAARPYPGINDAAERITVVSKLAQQFPKARLIYSGGSEADTAADLLEAFGISRSRIEVELQSRNTIENAIFTKGIAEPRPGQRWLLVTSAFHMPRAVGVFRQLGFPVEAYPVDWRTPGPEDDLIPFGSLADGLRQVDLAIHEWSGLIAYRLTGKTSALFPAPVE
jgi:uncharacterized SAM-binding protein YcdF (DUF218 family)